MKKRQSFLFPQRLLIDKWTNKRSQLTFITHMLRVGRPEIVFWNEIQEKRHVIMDHISNFKPTNM